jgi:hypothetical protein
MVVRRLDRAAVVAVAGIAKDDLRPAPSRRELNAVILQVRLVVPVSPNQEYEQQSPSARQEIGPRSVSNVSVLLSLLP